MATNDFQIFCNGVPGGTGNSLSVAAYLTLLAGGLRLSGFEEGVAESIQVNTILRQVTTVAAAFGQFIADRGIDAEDQESYFLLKVAFENALQAFLPASHPGMMTPFAGATPPAGTQWRHCRGQVVERAAYPDLFTAIGTLYGAPSGSEFNLPDCRGVFLRGQDASRGLDPSRPLGSFQSDTYAAHHHVVDLQPLNSSDSGGAGKVATGNNSVEGVIPPFNTSDSGSTETRPKNLCTSFLIWIGDYSGTGTPI